MGIYEQLTRLSYRFPVKKSNVNVPVGATNKLVDASPCRLYIAFSSQVLNGALTVSNILPTTALDGFPSATNPTLLEFWLEKHKSMVGQQWFAFNSSTSIMTVFITEVVYSDIEEENAQGMNDGQTIREANFG